jgi:predicted RNA-binding protein with PIN domain
VATVLVDGENVRRSRWPNIGKRELEALCERWAQRHGHDVLVIWESDESADERIERDSGLVPEPVWVVTSDRELRDRVRTRVEHFVGGGAFVRELTGQRP